MEPEVIRPVDVSQYRQSLEDIYRGLDMNGFPSACQAFANICNHVLRVLGCSKRLVLADDSFKVGVVNSPLPLPLALAIAPQVRVPARTHRNAPGPVPLQDQRRVEEQREARNKRYEEWIQRNEELQNNAQGGEHEELKDQQDAVGVDDTDDEDIDEPYIP